MIPNDGTYKCSTLEGDPICEGNGERVTMRDGEMIFSCSNSHSVAIVLQALQGAGYSIYPPGSSVPKLVAAAVAFVQCDKSAKVRFGAQLAQVALVVGKEKP